MRSSRRSCKLAKVVAWCPTAPSAEDGGPPSDPTRRRRRKRVVREGEGGLTIRHRSREMRTPRPPASLPVSDAEKRSKGELARSTLHLRGPPLRKQFDTPGPRPMHPATLLTERRRPLAHLFFLRPPPPGHARGARRFARRRSPRFESRPVRLSAARRARAKNPSQEMQSDARMRAQRMEHTAPVTSEAQARARRCHHLHAWSVERSSHPLRNYLRALVARSRLSPDPRARHPYRPISILPTSAAAIAPLQMRRRTRTTGALRTRRTATATSSTGMGPLAVASRRTSLTARSSSGKPPGSRTITVCRGRGARSSSSHQ